jgi:hypothetical protein
MNVSSYINEIRQLKVTRNNFSNPEVDGSLKSDEMSDDRFGDVRLYLTLTFSMSISLSVLAK